MPSLREWGLVYGAKGKKWESSQSSCVSPRKNCIEASWKWIKRSSERYKAKETPWRRSGSCFSRIRRHLLTSIHSLSQVQVTPLPRQLNIFSVLPAWVLTGSHSQSYPKVHARLSEARQSWTQPGRPPPPALADVPTPVHQYPSCSHALAPLNSTHQSPVISWVLGGRLEASAVKAPCPQGPPHPSIPKFPSPSCPLKVRSALLLHKSWWPP